MPDDIISVDDLFSAHRDAPDPERPGDKSNDKYDMLPFLRLPPIGSKERLEMTLSAMNRRLLWLAERGGRPSSSAIERRDEIMRQLDGFSGLPEKVGAGGAA